MLSLFVVTCASKILHLACDRRTTCLSLFLWHIPTSHTPHMALRWYDTAPPTGTAHAPHQHYGECTRHTISSPVWHLCSPLDHMVKYWNSTFAHDLIVIWCSTHAQCAVPNTLLTWFSNCDKKSWNDCPTQHLLTDAVDTPHQHYGVRAHHTNTMASVHTTHQHYGVHAHQTTPTPQHTTRPTPAYSARIT